MKMTGGKRKRPLLRTEVFSQKAEAFIYKFSNSKYNKASAYIQYKNMKTEEKCKWKKTRQN